MSKTAEEIVDAALGIDSAQIARIDRLCEQAFPARSSHIAAQIRHAAKMGWSPNEDDAYNLAAIRALAVIKGAAFVRATPTPDQYVTHTEATAKQKGVTWDAEKRLGAYRKAQSMSPEELLEAVPATFEAPAVVTSAPIATKPTAEEDLDRLVEQRFGMLPGTARSLSALDRQRYHAALKKAEAARTTNSVAPASATDLKDPVARMAAARRAAASK